MKNLDEKTVASFGDEWTRFDQTGMSEAEAQAVFQEYFSVFPWDVLPADAEGYDMGCGTGRWAKWVAPKVGRLHCIDPSDAIEVAKQNLASATNVVLHRGGVDDCTLPPGSQDFGYSLGVLHHVPDTQAAIASCVRLLKDGAPLLIYLYYAFDNRSVSYRAAWRASDLLRRLVCRMPSRMKHLTTDLIAAFVYLPLAKLGALADRIGIKASGLPLYYYRQRSFYTMRTDSRDRFGTPLEQRFTRGQIQTMMTLAGLGDIHFSESPPYWCAVGFKKADR